MTEQDEAVRRCGACKHPGHWRECRASGCYCRRRGPQSAPDPVLAWLREQRKDWTGYAEAAVLESLIASREKEQP